MKIIYFTTACQKEDYVSLSLAWRISLNSSIQNLHNRLIRALALTHEVEVLSFRPFSKRHCALKKLEAEEKPEGKITWHYSPIKRQKLFRYICAYFYTRKIMKKTNLKEAIIFTETLNSRVLQLAKIYSKKYNLPIIGVCHNTPSGIPNTKRAYTLALLDKAKNLSGYLTTTPGLNNLFNRHSRPSLVFSGILENKYQEIDCSQYGHYFYYDGNLSEKYGIYNLISAFKKLNLGTIKLIISGYHSNEEKLKKIIADVPNIVYLGSPNNDIVLSLINDALININPRPFSEDFDRYLIPDNLIDYLGADKALTLTVRNNRLEKDFKEAVVWIDSSEVEGLTNGIKACLSLTDRQKEHMIRRAKTDAVKLFSMATINRKAIAFLKQFLK
ncbi:MAG: glycosyltransferase [Erysipelotrichia bacterium]|nr:glycosyltransferase [Erysipelotrichia bacterium]